MLIQLPGLSLRVDGPPALVDELREEYPCSPEPDGSAQARLEWHDRRGSVAPWGREFLVDSEQLIPPVTRVLLRRIMAMANPNLLFLHANAVWIGGSTVVLVGPSGAGKSTLTWCLLERGGSLMCEDLAPIDVASGNLLPHHRASRMEEHGESRFCSAPRHWAHPVPAHRARLVFLTVKDQAEAKADGLTLSAWNDEAAALMSDYAPTGWTVARQAGSVVVSFHDSPSSNRLARLVERLDALGILVLATNSRAATPIDRPPHPVFAPLGPDRALRLAMANLAGPLPVAGAELLMKLAQMLPLADSWALEPGGTPEETAAMLVGVLRAI